jgi:hypothetical protein
VVAQLLPDHLRGNGFGVLGLVQSLGDLGSSAVVGVLWSLVSPQLAFGYAATWMAASLAATRATRIGAGQIRQPEPSTSADAPEEE